MTHPDKSMLLAYVRQQPCDDWPGGIFQLHLHVADCPECRLLCAEYIRISKGIDTYVHSSVYSVPYPSLVGSVLQQTEQLRQRKVFIGQRLGQHLAQHLLVAPRLRVISLPMALILVLSIVLFAAAYGIVRLPAGSSTLAGGHITAVKTAGISNLPQQTTTAQIPTNNGNSSGGRSGVTTSAPSLFLCLNQNDVQKWRLRICGSHFIPGSIVRLVVQTTGKEPKIRHELKVATDGTLQDMFMIADCDDVPVAITAVSADRTQEAQLLENIQFGNCSVPTGNQTPFLLLSYR